ncbi:MAG: hypothetical protein ACE5H4_02785 [Candidatus Thorarchaeota archaeon]
MKGAWYHIAKAEFLVLTSRFRRRRRIMLLGILVFTLVWALFLVPSIMSYILGWMGTEVNALLMIGLPGFMRSFVLFLWVTFLFYPISYALEELKIGQWEIMLSSDVSTRDIMTGTFVGKIPVYGLGILFLTSIIVSPYAIVYQVSLAGQLLMYLTLIGVALSTLWFSNLLCTAIQAKLGESPRGNDVARALSMFVGLVTLIPLYGIIFLAEPFSEFMGLDIFLIFPFTWGADLVTWVIVLFNGIGLSPSSIVAFESILGFGPAVDLALLVTFSMCTVTVALVTADRLFRIEAGARSERVTTVGKENIVLRGMRQLFPGSFGILVVSVLKDFTRKAQNTSKIAFGVVLAVVFPLMLNVSGIGGNDPGIVAFYSALTAGVMLAMIGAMTFGGVGFLDSKDQLWMLKSAPNGVTNFVRARIVESMMFALPMAWTSSTFVCMMIGLHGFDALMTLTNACLAVTGSILVSTGITANNPNYDDQQSKTFKDNTGASMLVIMITTQLAIPIGLLTGFQSLILMILGPSAVMISLGSVFTTVGTRRLARPD